MPTTIFELIFLLLFLTTVVTLATATVAALRGQRPRAGRILRRLAIGAAFYFAVVLIVAAASVPPTHRVGETICFDDWCFTVADAKRAPGSAQSWNVTLRISSRAKRVTMGENEAVVYLTDSRHRRFDPDPASATVPLDSKVGPGESLDVTRNFELPPDATDIALVFTHERGFPIEAFIIGENELFHHTTVIKLD